MFMAVAMIYSTHFTQHPISRITATASDERSCSWAKATALSLVRVHNKCTTAFVSVAVTLPTIWSVNFSAQSSRRASVPHHNTYNIYTKNARTRNFQQVNSASVVPGPHWASIWKVAWVGGRSAVWTASHFCCTFRTCNQ